VASESRSASDRLVWIDCEMTGLDLSKDLLVEIACIVTEPDLTELDSGINLVITAPAEVLSTMDPVVNTMHRESGLLDKIPGGIALGDAEEQVLNYVKQHIPEPRKAPLAGSSVYVDRMFLAKYMPMLDAYLHYRLVDVSTVKELAKRWYPRTYYASPEKRGNHRALGDIRESIAELRYYRDAVLVPHPGPDSEAARNLAAQHTVNHS